MALPIVVAKNQTASPIFLPRLGLSVPASSQITLTDFASFYEISWEAELYTRVAALDIVINDGVSDLSADVAGGYLDATGNLNGPVTGLVTNTLLKLDGTSGRYTKASGITVDASDNMNLGAGTITTTGLITGSGGALNVSVTPTASYIPRADASAYLDPGWVAKAQVVTVALSGSADFTSVKDAVDSIIDASTTKPYTVKVASGIYTESPFSLKSNVAIVGESMISTQIETNDNSNHFITGASGAMLKNLAIKGPTGTGFAAINHTTASTTPLQVHHCLIRAGYYGIWCHPAASRGIVHAFFTANWYSGSRIENFFRASDFGNITAVVCNFMNGANSSCGTGFYVTGSNAEMTLDECNHRNKGSDNNIYVDDGAKVRAMAFAFSRGLNGIHIGPTGTNSRVYAAGCTMRRDVDTQTITSFVDYNGTVPGTTRVNVATAHGMLTGAHAIITSAAPGTYDGHRIITVIDSTSFYITVAYNGDLVPATYTVGAIQGSNILIDAGANLPIIEYSGGTINTRHITDGGTGTALALGASELPEGGGAGSFVVFDELKVGTLAGTIPVGHYLRDTGFTGYFRGGAVTDAGGLTVDVAAGEGWINTGTGLEPVDWLAQAGVTLTDDSENYIYIDVNGDVQVSASHPSTSSTILLAEVVTAAGDNIMNSAHRILVDQRAALFHTYAQEVLQNRWVSGLTVTATAPASLGFEVGSGVFYLADYRLTPAASATPCAFTLLYRDGAGGWIAITGYASGTVTVNNTLAAGDTITIGGTVLTGVAGARTPGSDDFDASLGTVGALATEIAAAINDGANSFAATVSAVANAAVVTITAVASGIGGDAITLAAATTPAAGLTVSGANLTGGDAGITEVPLTWDDDSGTPVALAAGEWVKHMSWVAQGDDGTQHFVQMGQEVFASQVLAEAGNNPAPFDYLEDDACRLYGIVVSDASTSIDAFVRAVLEIGAGGGGTTSTSAHGALSGLANDDHNRYADRTGNATRNAITGTFDFGGGGLLLPLVAVPAQTANGSIVWDSDDFRLTVGDGTSRKSMMNQGDTAGGDLGGTYPNPTVTDLTITGEVQGSLLYRNATNWVQLAPGTSGQLLRTNGAAANPSWTTAGAGDVVGPGSATDHAIARYDLTTGKLIQNSGILIDDSNNLQAAATVGIRSSGTGAFDMRLENTENLTAQRDLTITLGDADRTLSFGGNITTGGNLTLANAFTTSGAFPITLTATGSTNVTLPTTGTLLSTTTSTLQIAYNNGPSITTAASTPITLTLTSGGFTVAGPGAVNIGADATNQTINIGTGASPKTVTVGTTDSTSSTVIDSGTGNLDIGTGAQARSINLGTGAATQAVTVGSTTSASSLTSRTGTGAMTFTAGGIYDVNATGAVTLDSSGGTIGIGTDAVAQGINVGTGAAARTITVGNTTGATTVNVTAGTGHTNVTTGFALNGVITPTALAANTNDYSPTGFGTASTIRISSSTAVNLTGLAGGISGRVVIITNVGVERITLTDEDANSTAANRFAIPLAIRLNAEESAILQYDGTSNRWRAPATSKGTVEGATKNRFYQFASNASTAKGDHNTVAVGSNGTARFEMNIPDDFTTLVSIQAIMIPGATNATANIDLASDYAAIGEVYNVNSEADATTTYALTINVMTGIPLATVSTGIAAGDFFGVLVTHNAIGATANYLGTLLRYT